MKLQGKLSRIATNEDGELEATFVFGRGLRNKFTEISKDRLLEIDIKENCNQRTTRQNRAMWILLTEITECESGRRDKSLVEELYSQMLIEANIDFWFGRMEYSALKSLQNAFSAVDVIDTETVNGTKFMRYRAYKGSSEFTTKEMNTLIDVVLDRGAKYGIDIKYFADELRG